MGTPFGPAMGQAAAPQPLALLPDPHALLRWQVLRLSGLHLECFVPRIDIAHRQRTVFIWRMLILEQPPAQRGLAHLGAIRLCIGNEKTLIAGISVD